MAILYSFSFPSSFFSGESVLDYLRNPSSNNKPRDKASHSIIRSPPKSDIVPSIIVAQIVEGVACWTAERDGYLIGIEVMMGGEH